MNWKNSLSPSEAGFMQDIVDQVPELARGAFVGILDKLSEALPKEVQRDVAKLRALEAGGVDNWEGYDWSLEDAGWPDDEDEDEEDEE